MLYFNKINQAKRRNQISRVYREKRPKGIDLPFKYLAPYQCIYMLLLLRLCQFHDQLTYPKVHCHYSFSHHFYQRGVTFQFDGKIIMFDLGQCISYTILSTVIVISYILYILIIWYINTKALGTITSFDKVSIDTILIRLFQLTLIYIGVNIYMFDKCSMQDAKNIVLTLPNYILACLILSSEILNSSFRILFLQKQHWLDETSDTNIRRMAWVIRIIIAGR